MRTRLGCAAAAACLAAIPAQAQAESRTVTVRVEGVRSDAGRVISNLCADAQVVFCATYRASSAATPDGTALEFTGVAPGRYALVAFHDENGDGQPQIPPEGYAFGNGVTFPPTFEGASILVEDDAAATLGMTYIAGAPIGATSSGSPGAPAPAGVVRVDVRENGLYAAFYRPQTQERVPAIILLGGSEGGIDVISSMATSFALEGYGALALAYWGEQGLPQTLENIPLEYFDAAVEWLKSRPGVEADAIGVMGWSRGSEAALLLGARNPDIRAVGAIAPSGVVWQGLDFADMINAGPAWTAGGEPLAFLRADASAYRPNGPMAPIFENVLDDADARPETAIPVERIEGPILLISGDADALFPSVTFAGRIVARLEAAGFAHEVQNLVYPGAGHVVFVGAPDSPMARSLGAPNATMGGTAEANAAAWEDNWPRTLAFFGAALGESGR
jgi:hypothetical protein